MIFHSWTFLFFILLVFPIYWSLNKTMQNLFLIVVSYIFYCWVHPWFGLLLAGSTLVDYFSVWWASKNKIKDRTALIISLSVNLGMLLIFKYFNFFTENFNAVLETFGLSISLPILKIVLPVGISFYTFQTLSYSIDYFKEKSLVEKNFINFAAFVSFFPQLVAGPIERAKNLLPQMAKKRRVDSTKIRDALWLITWGYFKKLVIASQAGLICDQLFVLDQANSLLLAVGTLAFTVQIYADFSAYTDIARGIARAMGFELIKNFDSPYLAFSVADFWRRWHMSLSRWFRDYVYLPLGGRSQRIRNVLITFFISGLWHGANWNFILWGVLHGIAVALSPKKPKAFLLRLLFISGTFLFVVVTWYFFREQNESRYAWLITPEFWKWGRVEFNTSLYYLLSLLVFSTPLLLCYLLKKLSSRLSHLSPAWSWLSIPYESLGLLFLIYGCVYLSSSVKADFIYFQF